MSDIMLQMNNQIFNYVSDAARELYDSLKLIVTHSESVYSEVEARFSEGDNGFIGITGSFLGDMFSQECEYDVGIENEDTSFSSGAADVLSGIPDKVVESDGGVSSADTSFESDFSDLAADLVGVPIFVEEN